jgi:hypothetical protein
VFLVLFTWPAIYTRKKEVIDTQYDALLRKLKANVGRDLNRFLEIVEEFKKYRSGLIPDSEKKNQ